MASTLAEREGPEDGREREAIPFQASVIVAAVITAGPFSFLVSRKVESQTTGQLTVREGSSPISRAVTDFVAGRGNRDNVATGQLLPSAEVVRRPMRAIPSLGAAVAAGRRPVIILTVTAATIRAGRRRTITLSSCPLVIIGQRYKGVGRSGQGHKTAASVHIRTLCRQAPLRVGLNAARRLHAVSGGGLPTAPTRCWAIVIAMTSLRVRVTEVAARTTVCKKGPPITISLGLPP